MLPNETPGPPPEQFSKKASLFDNFGSILEAIWEPVLLTLGTFFDKKLALKSRRIYNTFFLDYGSDLERPDTQSDRAGSIQTHVGTFPKKTRFLSDFTPFWAPKLHKIATVTAKRST